MDRTQSDRKPQLVAMVHVPSNNILQNTVYNDYFNLPTYTPNDLIKITKVRKSLYKLLEQVKEEYKINFLDDCRTSIFVLKQTELKLLIDEMLSMEFVQYLVSGRKDQQ